MSVVTLKLVISGVVALVYGGSPEDRVTIVLPTAAAKDHSAVLVWSQSDGRGNGALKREPLDGIELAIFPAQAGSGAVSRTKAQSGCPIDANQGYPATKDQVFSWDWSIEMRCLGTDIGVVKPAVLTGGAEAGVRTRWGIRHSAIRVKTVEIATDSTEMVGIAFKDSTKQMKLFQAVSQLMEVEIRLEVPDDKVFQIVGTKLGDLRSEVFRATPVVVNDGGERSARVLLFDQAPQTVCNGSVFDVQCTSITRMHFGHYYPLSKAGKGPLPLVDSRRKFPIASMYVVEPQWGIMSPLGRPICLLAAFSEQ